MAQESMIIIKDEPKFAQLSRGCPGAAVRHPSSGGIRPYAATAVKLWDCRRGRTSLTGAVSSYARYENKGLVPQCSYASLCYLQIGLS